MARKDTDKQPHQPPGDRKIAYDEAPAGQELDGGESILSGRSRERRETPADVEPPPTDEKSLNATDNQTT